MDNEVWEPKSHFMAILDQTADRIKGIYLVEKGKCCRVSELSAYATLAINEELARGNRRFV